MEHDGSSLCTSLQKNNQHALLVIYDSTQITVAVVVTLSVFFSPSNRYDNSFSMEEEGLLCVKTISSVVLCANQVTVRTDATLVNPPVERLESVNECVEFRYPLKKQKNIREVRAVPRCLRPGPRGY